MDRISIFIEENINGYNLPADTLSEIRSVLLKRFGVKFSEGLSPEGRLAMEQAAKREVESAKSARRNNPVANSPERDKTKQAKTDQNKEVMTDQNKQTKTDQNKQVQTDQNEKRTKSINFQDTYERSTSGRLDGDITDESFSELDLKKRAIGGKIENAFETIEIITHGEEGRSQSAGNNKRHSVEKCLVWMEVHNEAPTPSSPGSSHSRDTSATETVFEEL